MSQPIYIVIIGIMALWIIYLYEPEPPSSPPPLVMVSTTPDFDSGCSTFHRIAPGDTLWSIAHLYGHAGYEYEWMDALGIPYDRPIHPDDYLCVQRAAAPLIWYDGYDVLVH